MSDETIQSQDPAIEWSELLHGLGGAQRHAVVEALRHSASSGWPASREAVSCLVAYAQGRISSREYAARTLVALGYTDARMAAAQVARDSLAPDPARTPAPANGRFDASAGSDFLFGRQRMS